MRKDETSETTIGCLIVLLLMPFGALWRGYVLSILWGWFIVTTFETRPLGVLPAIGVAVVVGYLTKQTDEYIDKNKTYLERIAFLIANAFISPAFALFFGWILHSFM